MAFPEPSRRLAAIWVAVVVAAVLWVGTECVLGVVGFCVYGKDEAPPVVVTLAAVAPWLVALAGGIAAGRSVSEDAGASGRSGGET